MASKSLCRVSRVGDDVCWKVQAQRTEQLVLVLVPTCLTFGDGKLSEVWVKLFELGWVRRAASEAKMVIFQLNTNSGTLHGRDSVNSSTRT